MRLWRVAAETRSYRADDLTGGGAARSPGRWNNDQEPVVYCATTRAMAVLETSAHVDTTGLPLNRFLIEIDVPTATWAKRQTLTPAMLSPAWAAIPAGAASSRVGSTWLASLSSAILVVPSVIVPEEQIVLINPRHPTAASIAATVVRRFEYDVMFRR